MEKKACMNKKHSHHIGFIFLLITFSLMSCTSYQSLRNFTEPPRIPTEPQQIKNFEPIILQPSDVVQVRLSSSDPLALKPFVTTGNSGGDEGANLSDEFLISEDGTITFPLVGDILIADLTIKAAKEKVLQSISPYFEQQPLIQMRLMNFNVHVNGEVARPGAYFVGDDRISIIEALTMAGDFTSYSRRDSVMVIRERAGIRSFGYVDFKSYDVFESPYYYLKQNDMIYVMPDKTKVNSIRDPGSRILPWVSSAVSVAVLLITITRR